MSFHAAPQETVQIYVAVLSQLLLHLNASFAGLSAAPRTVTMCPNKQTQGQPMKPVVATV